MAKQPSAWFFVVDAGRGRLLRCSRTRPGRLHVDEEETIENHTEEYEHGRPSPRVGKGGHSYASEGHESEQQMRRFAKQVVTWIEAGAQKHGIDRVTLFSAPRFLGELRKVYPPMLAASVDERTSDLTQLNEGSLGQHPAIAELLPDES